MLVFPYIIFTEFLHLYTKTLSISQNKSLTLSKNKIHGSLIIHTSYQNNHTCVSNVIR